MGCALSWPGSVQVLEPRGVALCDWQVCGLGGMQGKALLSAGTEASLLGSSKGTLCGGPGLQISNTPDTQTLLLS